MKYLFYLSLVVFAISCSPKNQSIQGEQAREFSVKASSVDEIYLFDQDGKKVHLKKEGSNWRLNDSYTARPDAIAQLLETMEYVKFRNPVAEKAHDNMVKNLISRHIKVEVFSKGENIMSYLVGTQTQDGAGTFYLKEDTETGDKAERMVVCELPGFNGYLTPRYIIQESLWRNRSVFQYGNGEISKLTVNYPANLKESFSIEIKDGAVKLFDHEGKEESNVNDLAVKEYLLNYKQVNFEAIATKDMSVEIDSLLSTDPYFSITVTNSEGKENRLDSYRRKPLKEELDINGNPLQFDTDRLFALQNDKKELLVIQYFVFDALTILKTSFLQPAS